MIIAKINVAKVDKSKLFEGKNGAKYLDACLIETPNDQYGNDFMVVQGVSKEERDAGKRGEILGNAKIMGGGQRRLSAPQGRSGPTPQNPPPDDDVPF